MTDEEYIAHHGIKGMKWGVRRTPEQLGHKPKSVKVKINTQSKSKSEAESKPKPSGGSSRKSAKEMSDDELRRAISRIELERKYAQLTAPQKSKGKRIAQEIIGNAAKQTATKYVNKAMDKAVENLIKKASRSGGSGGGP